MTSTCERAYSAARCALRRAVVLLTALVSETFALPVPAAGVAVIAALIAVDGPTVQAQSSKRTRFFDDGVATERLRRLPSLYDHMANTGSRVQIIHKSEQRIMTGTDLAAMRSI